MKDSECGRRVKNAECEVCSSLHSHNYMLFLVYAGVWPTRSCHVTCELHSVV